MLQPGKLNVVIGGQFGSEGKGKVYGWFYENEQVDLSVCDFMPNAGHTCIMAGTGKKVVSKIVPIGGWYNKTCVIGPQAVFDTKRLVHEVADIEDNNKALTGLASVPEIWIHPEACTVSDEDRRHEELHVNGIASTKQGSAEAVIRKLRRPVMGGNTFRNDVLSNTDRWNTSDTFAVVNAVLDHGGVVLAETAQGFSLGINSGFYPYTTSRDCLLGRVCDNAGVSPKRLGTVIGVIRTFPIRVGNTVGGNSGPCYGDQVEIDWGTISKIRGVPTEELTTVTRRVRRVFTFSYEQLRRFLQIVRPDYLVLNFVDYIADRADRETFVDTVWETAEQYDCQLAMVGTGPGPDQYARF